MKAQKGQQTFENSDYNENSDARQDFDKKPI